MLRVIISILALGFIVIFHELGHFLTAKAFGISVVEFTVGLGPVLVSQKHGSTRYSLRALPFGGACVMYQESGEDEETEGEEKTEFPEGSGFQTQPAWKRFLVIFAGPFFNFLLAFLLAVVFIFNVGYDRPVIADVTEGSPAWEAGLRAGDRVRSLEVSGMRSGIRTGGDIQLFFLANQSLVDAGKPVRFKVIASDGAEKNGEMTSVYNEEYKKSLFGFSYSRLAEPCDNVWDLMSMSVHQVKYTIQMTVESIRMLIRGDLGAESIGGPVQIVAVMDESVEAAKEQGGNEAAALTLLELAILLSGSMGAMNLLPLPALDGGRLLLLLVEMITRKKLPQKLEAAINFAGLMILLALMVLVMFKDIIWLVLGK